MASTGQIQRKSNLKWLRNSDIRLSSGAWPTSFGTRITADRPEGNFDKLLGRIHPGAVVLLHSTSSTNAEILDELPLSGKRWVTLFKSLDQLKA